MSAAAGNITRIRMTHSFQRSLPRASSAMPSRTSRNDDALSVSEVMSVRVRGRTSAFDDVAAFREEFPDAIAQIALQFDRAFADRAAPLRQRLISACGAV